MLKRLAILGIAAFTALSLPGQPNKTTDNKEQPAAAVTQPLSLRTAQTNCLTAIQIKPKASPTRQSGTLPSKGPIGGSSALLTSRWALFVGNLGKRGKLPKEPTSPPKLLFNKL